MPHVAAMPRYRTLGLSAAGVALLAAGMWALELQVDRDIRSLRTLLSHLVLVSFAVFGACAALRLFLNWRFDDIVLQIDDVGIYVEGVTREPVKWASVTALTDRKRFVTFRTTDEKTLIHFALHRACFGRVGRGKPREVTISAGLIDLPVGEIHRAIARGMERYAKAAGATDTVTPSPAPLTEEERRRMWARPNSPAAPRKSPSPPAPAPSSSPAP